MEQVQPKNRLISYMKRPDILGVVTPQRTVWRMREDARDHPDFAEMDDLEILAAVEEFSEEKLAIYGVLQSNPAVRGFGGPR